MEEEQKIMHNRYKSICERGKVYIEDRDPSQTLQDIRKTLENFTPSIHQILACVVKSLTNRKYYSFHHSVRIAINDFFRDVIDYCLKYLKKENTELLLVLSRVLKSKKKFYDVRYTDIPVSVEEEYLSSCGLEVNNENNEHLVDPDTKNLNFFYISNIHFFYSKNGFTKILELVSETISLETTVKIILFISSFYNPMIRNKWREISKALKFKIFLKVQKMSDEEVRILQRHDLRSLFCVFENFLQKLYNYAKAGQIIENCELDLSFRLLTSKYLEKRIMGIVDLNQKIAKNKEKMPYHSLAEIGKLGSQNLVAWIESHQVIEIVFGSSTHPEIIKRSGELLKFLYSNSRFTRNNISKLWDLAFLKHETDRDALICLFSELAHVLKQPDLQHLFSKIYVLELHEIDSQILGLVKNLVYQLSKYAAKSNNDKEKTEFTAEEPWKQCEEIKENYEMLNQENFSYSEVLEFIWKLCLSQSINNGITFTISTQAFNILKDSLVSYCKTERYKFLMKCAENIKTNSSVVTSCKLMEEILNSYSDMRSNFENESKALVIKNLDREFHLFSELFTNLLLFKKEAVERAQIVLRPHGKLEESHEESCYTCSSDDDSQESEKRGKRHAEVFMNMRVSPDCEMNYLEELKFRLEFIKFLYQNSAETLQVKYCQVLWEAIVLNPVLEDEHEILFVWINSTLNTWFSERVIINEELTHLIFTDMFLKLDPRSLSLEGYLCFEKFFINLNKQHGIISNEYDSDMEIRESSLLGIQYLWEIILQARNKKVFKSATKFLKKIYKGLKQPQDEAIQEMIRNCMEFISEGSERYRSHTDFDAINQISRSLSLLIDFLRDYEIKNSKQTLDLTIENQISNTFPKTFLLTISPNVALKNLKILISTRISPKIEVSDIILFVDSKNLNSRHDQKSLHELGIENYSRISVFNTQREFDNTDDPHSENLNQLKSIFACYSDEILSMALENSGNSFDDAVNILLNEDLVSNIQSKIDSLKLAPKLQEKANISEIISNSQHYFALLFSLFDIAHEGISDKVWELLVKIPVNTAIYNSLKVLNDNSWTAILSTTCMHKLLYGLKIVWSILDQSNSETNAWKGKFISRGCLDHLYKILMESHNIEFTSSEKASSLCVELLIRIVKYFTYECLVGGNSELSEPSYDLLNSLDFSGLMAKMLEIIESCINKELESTSVIESALDLMVPLIVHNSELLSELYNMGSFNCLIGFLLDSSKISVRQAIKLTISSIVESVPSPPQGLEAPITFFKRTLLKKLPTDKHDFCDEYFEILVKLFGFSSEADPDLIINCLNYIQNHDQYEDIHQDKVLTGYLNLLSVLIEGQDFDGSKIIKHLYEGLFEIPSNSLKPPPRLKHEPTRKAAFSLLISLVRYSSWNSQCLLEFLGQNHLSIQFEGFFDSEVLSKSPSGFVGLRNFGATCYMNSLIQELFMIKEFRKGIQNALLVVEDPEESLEDNLVYQLKDMFWNLQESDKQYYEPIGFCGAFKDYDGQPMNVKQQQDADEFFNIFCDKIEEILKPTHMAKLLRDTFGGVLVHEIESCEPDFPYKSQREEQFYRISLDLKNKKTLAEALDLYIKEDLLEGDNKYLCEQYNCKITAKKRCVIQSLSNTVIIHLKRFEFNYSTMQRTKINDYCEFPMKLDLRSWSIASELNDDYYNYDLVGVLVHSGYADVGHYYSIIKDRDSQMWYKFDDKYVEAFDIGNLKEECFGGESYANWSSDMMGFCKNRNAYMLVYERTTLQELKEEEHIKDPNCFFINSSDQIKAKIRKENHEFLRDKLLFDSNYSEFLKDFTEHCHIPSIPSVPKDLSLTEDLYKRNSLRSIIEADPGYLTCTITELESKPEIIEILIQGHNFYRSLENTYSFGLTLIKISTLYALELLLRAKKSSYFIVWLKKISDIAKVHLPGCFWFLQFLTQNKKIIVEILIENRDCDVRNEVKNLICNVLTEVSEAEKDYLIDVVECLNNKALPFISESEDQEQVSLYSQKWRSTTARFWSVMLGYTFRRALNSPKTNSEYFSLLRQFSYFNSQCLELLLYLGVISKLYTAFVADYSSPMQSNSQSFDNEQLIEIVAGIIQRSTTQSMKATSTYPKTYQFSHPPVMLINYETCLCNQKSIRKLISFSKHRDCRNILIHLSWENLSFSLESLSSFAISLFDFKFDQNRYMPLLKIGFYLLSLDDSIKYTRVREFLNLTISKIHYSHEPNTFFDALHKTKTINSMFFCSVIIWWSDLMNFEHVERTSEDQAEKFKDIIHEGLGFRHNPTAIFWDYMDNTRSLQQEVTLAYKKIAKLVDSDSEVEDEPENIDNVESSNDSDSTISNG